MSKPKTIKELNDVFNAFEVNLGNTNSKLDALEQRTLDSISLNESILSSIKNIDSRLDNNNNNDVLSKLDEHSASMSEKLDTTTNSIKEDIAIIRTVVIAKLQDDNRKLRTRVTYLENRMLENERNSIKARSAWTKNLFRSGRHSQLDKTRQLENYVS